MTPNRRDVSRRASSSISSISSTSSIPSTPPGRARRWRALGIGGAMAALFGAGWGLHLAQAHTRISTDLTWSKDIQPIFREKCMSCHSPGGVAPAFVNLTVYGGKAGQTGARDWAKAIEEELQTGRMPPWQADDRYGEFSNHRALTKQEKDYILWWATGGAPQGTPRDLPAPEEFVNRDFTLGEPDLVVEAPEEFVLPPGVASAVFTFKTQLPAALGVDDKGAPRDKTWLTGYEFLPGGAEAVESILAWAVDPEGAPEDAVDVEIQKPYNPLADEDALEEIRPRPLSKGTRFLGQWVRGDAPVFFPDESGKRLRGGAIVEVQVVMRKQGVEDLQKEFRSRPKLGLFFAKSPMEYIIETGRIEKSGFVAHVGASSQFESASWKLAEDAHLVSLHPHLGPTAREFEIMLNYPDGRARTLLLVQDFKPKWNSSYALREPVRAPAGSTVSLQVRYDNTRDNPNLRQAKTLADVTIGDQPGGERMLALIDYTLDNHLFNPTPTPTPLPRLTPAPGSGMLFDVPVSGANAEGEGTPEVVEPELTLNNLGGALAEAAEEEGVNVAAPAVSAKPADAKSSAGPDAAPTKDGKAAEPFWCPMRCEKVDYHQAGKCPVCNMDLEPKGKVLEDKMKLAGGLTASKDYAWPMTADGRAEVYWCPNRGQKTPHPGHDLKDHAGPGKCEVCDATLVHHARFEQPKTYMCLTDSCDSSYARDKVKNLFYSAGLCPDCGEPVEGMGHMDHNPVHGGKFFMADNMYHHLEGTLEKPDEFHLYFYDDWKKPLDPRNFAGRVIFETYDEAKDDYDRKEYKLEYPNLGSPYLKTTFPAVTRFPAEFTAKVWLSGEEKLYTFIFDELTQAGAGAAGEIVAHKHGVCPTYNIPADPAAIAQGIYEKAAALRALIDADDVLNLHCDAFAVMDSVDALREAQRSKKLNLDARKNRELRDALDQTRQGAYFLHEYGHTGDAARVEKKAWKQFSAGVEGLRKLFP